MGSFKDFFGGLLSKGHKGGPVLTRNPAHLELKGCTDAECTLATPNDTRVKMGLEPVYHLRPGETLTIPPESLFSEGLFKAPDKGIVAGVHLESGDVLSFGINSSINTANLDLAATEVSMECGGTTVQFIRKDEADAKIQARDAEIAVLKAQLSEYRTFKDPDTDNVDLP
jgi:hypothetical protein